MEELSMLNFVIILALLATIGALGIGLLSMGIGGNLDRDFGERFMWIRISLQGVAVLLILVALIIANV